MTWREDGAPTNGVALNLEHWCIDNSHASYSLITGLPIIQEELFESKLAAIDPPWGGTASYITAYENGQVSLKLTGITMVSISTMVDPWTYVLPANIGRNEEGRESKVYKADGVPIQSKLENAKVSPSQKYEYIHEY